MQTWVFLADVVALTGKLQQWFYLMKGYYLVSWFDLSWGGLR